MTTTTVAPIQTTVQPFTCASCGKQNEAHIFQVSGEKVCAFCGVGQPTKVFTSSVNQLKVADRCDYCRAQAFGRVTMRGSEFELLFCGHHLAENMDKLMEVASKIEDYRGAINEKP